MSRSLNSYFLVLYLLMAFAYYFVGTGIRAILFPSVFFLSIVVYLLSSTNSKGQIFISKKIYGFIVLFCIVFVTQVINLTISPFIFYLISTPCMSFFILKSKFNVRIIKIPLYIFSLFFIVYFIKNRTLMGVFPEMSWNYVSVVMIMNTIIVYLIEKNERLKISFTPAFLCLLTSLLATGRSGILCSLLLFLFVLHYKWKYISLAKKWMLFFLLLLPFISIIIYNINTIIQFFGHLTIMEKFTERGIDSPSRGIMIREYLANLSLKNILLGYNFNNNYWFIHYGLNPHNSYIRLHYYFGISFFVVVSFILYYSKKLFKSDKLLFGFVIVILIRAYTDTVLFQYIYDFVLLTLLLSPIKHIFMNKNIESNE